MKAVRLFLLVAAMFAITATTIAQEGHPLAGTWYGDFGPTSARRNDLTVVLKWDGSQASGLINPGPGSIPIKTARMDVKLGDGRAQGQRGAAGEPARDPIPPQFLVHFEVDAKNKAGGVDRFVFTGKIENPVAGNRTIVGTWTCGNEKGDFRLRRM
jgi:hypothetical protein